MHKCRGAQDVHEQPVTRVVSPRLAAGSIALRFLQRASRGVHPWTPARRSEACLAQRHRLALPRAAVATI